MRIFLRFWQDSVFHWVFPTLRKEKFLTSVFRNLIPKKNKNKSKAFCMWKTEKPRKPSSGGPSAPRPVSQQRLLPTWLNAPH